MVIVNRDELAAGDRFREDALDIVEAGLKACKVENIMGSVVEEDRICVEGVEYRVQDYERVHVVGFGKASGSMACELESRWRDRIADGVVISYPNPGCRAIRVLEGTHPMQSEGNIRASEELLDIVSNAGERDLIVCLISGGGSAMFTKPVADIALEDLVRTNRLLLDSGGDINEINAVRKRIDYVKGGGLARACNCKVVSLIISDVVGDRLDVIASGPTVRDSTTFEEAIGVLEKYGLEDRVPRRVLEWLREGVESEREDGEGFEHVSNHVIGGNGTARKAAADCAAELGYDVIDRGESEGEARELGGEHARRLEGCGKRTMLLSGGETTVTVTGTGKGGRNQDYVLGFLAQAKTPFVVCAVDTDGIDGYTDAAGALADHRTLENGLDPREYLKDNDPYNFFKQSNSLVFTGKTGTNVNDLRVAIKPG
ncbi:MAG: DUF4147 domain-containing protein [Candidatus Altiarchaeales archaeon]|nr:DUF4147 domain-containing protein [Candidatus Altiarchaeales archaeon]MBD3416631.1 DUF4147 domain-containing protein [Candidatus Altiarchaeales archaeon]